MAVFKKQGVYWIDYYVNGQRKRERIGPDKRLAETVLKKRKVEIAEGKFLEKKRPVTTTFDELADVYLLYASDQQQKRSWTRDRTSIATLGAYFGASAWRRSRQQPLSTIGPGVEPRSRGAGRRSHLPRLTGNWRVSNACSTSPAKELILLEGGFPGANPMAMVSLEREHNQRDRVLSAREFQRLQTAAALWLQPMLLVAYHTGMREGEIRSLRWDQVDLNRGVIRLTSRDTKTDEGRLIPLNQTLTSTLKTATRYMRCPWVFVSPAKLDRWQRTPEQVDPRYHATSITHAFERACEKAGVTHATFHDLRHTFVTNARRAGIDYFRIMAITGHKTMAVFKRYNTIDQQDLQAAIRQLDTYMDTTAADAQQDDVQVIDNTGMGR